MTTMDPPPNNFAVEEIAQFKDKNNEMDHEEPEEEKLAKKLMGMEKEMSELKTEIAAFQGQMAMKNWEIAGLQKSLKELKEADAMKNSKIAEMKRETEWQKNYKNWELSETEKAVKGLKEADREKNGAIKEVKRGMAEMKQKMDEKNIVFEELKAEIDKIKKKSQGRYFALEEVKKEISKLAKENEKLKNDAAEKNAEFEDKIIGMKKDYDNLHSKYGELRALKADKNELAILCEEVHDGMKKVKAATAVQNKPLSVSGPATINNVIGQNLPKKVVVAPSPFDPKQLVTAQCDFLAMENNKLDVEDCGLKMIFSKNQLAIKHPGPDGWKSARALLPILPVNLVAKKPSIACYYEVSIIANSLDGGITLGFSDLEFPLERKWPGIVGNSVGMWCKAGLYMDRSYKGFENDEGKGTFKNGDVIGIGLIHSPTNSSLECFATANGILFRRVKLPPKFVPLKLFPVVSLASGGDSVYVNFGKGEWLYNPAQLVQ